MAALFYAGVYSNPEAIRGIVMADSFPAGHILITGASGGLGRALVRELSSRTSDATARFTLWGRNAERLESVKELCRSKGVMAKTFSADVKHHDDAARTLLEQDAHDPIAVAFFNAGVSAGALANGVMEPADDVRRLMEVNGTSPMFLAATLLERMLERGRGHIIFMGSLASLYPLPSSPAYCASKVALSAYARAIRPFCRKRGVRISVIYPGYVDTPMSRRLKGPQPFRWSADKAAAYICQRLAAGSNTIVFPKFLALGMLSLHLLPAPIADYFADKFGFTIEPDAESPAAHRRENLP